ncbi:MAG: hypothetical protein ACI959_001664 [Limisphaerales bacterium]|jgi:hypothetical protein
MSTTNKFSPSDQLRAIPSTGLQPAVIVIPDISGFTEFVSNTAVEHSGHIITELLEAIIDANELDLELSEIEGDAVLFYRFGEVPSPEQIKSQAENMYAAFHQHLLLYESQRICDCGACSSASGLSLKVVAHAGGLSTMTIKGRSKLLGPDIIVAHRLLKNDIDSNEYVLLSDGWETAEGNWDVGGTKYSDLGEVKYRFRDLGYLKDQIELPEPIERKFNKIKNPASVSMSLALPLISLYEVVSNISRRPEWVEGLAKVDLSSDPLQRIGAHHVCVINGSKLDIEAFDVKKTESGDIEILELSLNAPFFGETISLIRLEKDNKGSNIVMEFHPQNVGFFGALVYKVLKGFIQKSFQKSLTNLNELLAKEGYLTSELAR